MQSNLAFPNSGRVLRFLRLSISICLRDEKDSLVALSGPSPGLPSNGIIAEARIIFLKDQEVY
jgi:hypothetical protein